MTSAGRVTRRRFLQLGSLSALGVATGGVRYVGASNALEVTRTTIALPGEGPAFTIALITDLHAPQPDLDFDAVVRAANAAEPDLVLIVGDAINRRGDEGLVEEYGPLRARVGKHAVAGNWENWGRVRRGTLADHYARADSAWLDNDVTDVPELGVRLIGLDEATNGWTEPDLVADAPADLLNIVLHHSPGAFNSLPLPPESPVLMVSGHTHGGQVAPLGRPLVLPPGSGGYVQGLYTRGRHRLYVSRGLGNSHVPFRVGARPEVAILDVKRTGAA